MTGHLTLPEYVTLSIVVFHSLREGESDGGEREEETVRGDSSKVIRSPTPWLPTSLCLHLILDYQHCWGLQLLLWMVDMAFLPLLVFLICSYQVAPMTMDQLFHHPNFWSYYITYRFSSSRYINQILFTYRWSNRHLLDRDLLVHVIGFLFDFIYLFIYFIFLSLSSNLM